MILFYIMTSVGFLFTLGMGIYVIKNVRELGEAIYHASGEAFGLSFHLWAYRVIGIFCIGFSVFILYMVFDTAFISS